jgi:hypothetical protein
MIQSSSAPMVEGKGTWHEVGEKSATNGNNGA